MNNVVYKGADDRERQDCRQGDQLESCNSPGKKRSLISPEG